MGWYQELQAILKTAARQLTNSSHVRPTGSVDTREPYFARNFHNIAHARGLTEADARDVYYHGSAVKQNVLVRKYNEYEIGIYFFVDGHTGKTVITSIWKRERVADYSPSRLTFFKDEPCLQVSKTHRMAGGVSFYTSEEKGEEGFISVALSPAIVTP